MVSLYEAEQGGFRQEVVCVSLQKCGLWYDTSLYLALILYVVIISHTV